MKPKVRFAPSPTGYLHIGGARTALFNWLFARHHGGDFLLRIEDTDRDRSTEESIEKIVDSLKWLCLDWDSYFRQTERNEIYEKYANQLLEEGSVYRSEGALWFQTPSSETVTVEDRIMGEVNYRTEELKDFVIRRSDGGFTYNFACTVDDMDTEITHVMRGDDHLNNTPKQILLYKAMGSKPPKFAHFPLILGEDGSRLSKRHGATSVLEYRKEGFLPEALINFLARLGWSHGNQEIFSRQELIDLFGLENVGSSPASFGKEKLLWLNNHWMKQRSPSELSGLLKKFLIKENIISEKDAESMPEEKFEDAAKALRKRNDTLVNMAKAGKFIFQTEIDYDKSLLKKQLGEKEAGLLKELGKHLEGLKEENFDAETLEEETRSFLEERGKTLGDVAQACRIVLTGREVSPGLFETMELAGRENLINRLDSAPDLRESSHDS